MTRAKLTPEHQEALRILTEAKKALERLRAHGRETDRTRELQKELFRLAQRLAEHQAQADKAKEQKP